SPEVGDQAMLTNLQEILAFKEEHPQQVVLLLGNHDIQYRFYPDFRCSGFRANLQKRLSALFVAHGASFQVAYQYRDYLFTHAGVTRRWYDKHEALILETWEKGNFDEFADVLNALAAAGHLPILGEIGEERGGLPGDDGGPFWADITESSREPFFDYHQVVGHTKVEDISRVNLGPSSVTYVDVLNTRTKFFSFET
ncbi:MAG: metallophosphoesterase, partial [Ferruginibacter sp.]|nr:metallophosphoesterase [Cytophagales bacterium]